MNCWRWSSSILNVRNSWELQSKRNNYISQDFPSGILPAMIWARFSHGSSRVKGTRNLMKYVQRFLPNKGLCSRMKEFTRTCSRVMGKGIPLISIPFYPSCLIQESAGVIYMLWAEFICWSPNPQCLRMWQHLDTGSLKW